MSEDHTLAIDRGYEQTHFEMAEVGNGYEVPTSEGPSYWLDERVSPADLQRGLEEREYAFIAPYTEDGYLSSKVLDCETNEFLHLKLVNTSLHVLPTDDDFSRETFERVVNAVNENVSGLQLEEGVR